MRIVRVKADAMDGRGRFTREYVLLLMASDPVQQGEAIAALTKQDRVRQVIDETPAVWPAGIVLETIDSRKPATEVAGV